jgi:hypothetical protein
MLNIDPSKLTTGAIGVGVMAGLPVLALITNGIACGIVEYCCLMKRGEEEEGYEKV